MSNLAKWNTPTAYASAGFTASDFNSLANGSVVVASTAITNSSALDMYDDVSFVFTVGGTTTAASYFSLYVLPLNQDASTYGDGIANGSAAPAIGYWMTNVGVKSGVTSGSTVTGTFPTVLIRPRNFKFAIVNNLGVALNAAAAATVQHSPFDTNLNA
jgi:hypothetical protein